MPEFRTHLIIRVKSFPLRSTH